MNRYAAGIIRDRFIFNFQNIYIMPVVNKKLEKNWITFLQKKMRLAHTE